MLSAHSPENSAPFWINSVESLDVDDQAASLSGWSQSYSQLSAGPFRGKTVQATLFDGLAYLYETSNCSLLQTSCTPSSLHTFAVLNRAAGPVRVGTQNLGMESVLSVPGNFELSIHVPENTTVSAIQFANSDMAHFAAVFETSVELEGLNTLRLSHSELTPMLRDFFRQIHTACVETPLMFAHEHTRRSLKSAALSNVMLVLSSAHVNNSKLQSSAARRRHLVQKAREHVEAHLNETPSVAELCLALGVSRRLLQYSFEEVLQVSPIAYIRAMRLNAIRRDLKNAKPRLTTVADLASRRGFWHLGHFAADYKKMFGELPSETLQTE